jgi:hypothetical protein
MIGKFNIRIIAGAVNADFEGIGKDWFRNYV